MSYSCRHEVVNINLKDKPDWFLDKNSKGSVPTIELNGKVMPPLLRMSQGV